MSNALQVIHPSLKEQSKSLKMGRLEKFGHVFGISAFQISDVLTRNVSHYFGQKLIVSRYWMNVEKTAII